MERSETEGWPRWLSWGRAGAAGGGAAESVWGAEGKKKEERGGATPSDESKRAACGLPISFAGRPFGESGNSSAISGRLTIYSSS